MRHQPFVVLFLFLLPLSIAGCGDKSERVSEAQMGEIVTLLDKTEAQFNQELANWRDQIRALSAGELPVTEQACPSGGAELSQRDVTARAAELDTLIPEFLENIGLAIKNTHESLAYQKEQGKPLHASTHKMLMVKLAKPPRESKGHLVLAVDTELKPKMIDSKTYEPGFVKGRLLWWDRAAGKFTCGGVIEAVSDEKMVSYGNKGNSVQNNLEYRARERGLGSLLVLQ